MNATTPTGPIAGIKAANQTTEKASIVYQGLKNSKTYTPVQFEGTVKVDGQTRDISRKVYQRNDIDWQAIDPESGLTNYQLAKQGRAPIGPDGMPMELHHVIQKEPGPMVEVYESTHGQYHKVLHRLVEDGRSFRNNDVLEKQYNNFRKKYWRWRAKQLVNEGGN
ncbi:hypothetical protein CEN49_17265 [Fischerella thermalis CCMEE 5273]|nr:hypothetical protein CEN49_17265 [Fischerella thermalis CCMEE 5273]